MNTRERMRASNKLVREWLLGNGYDQIWFKPHGKRNDYVFTQKGSYMAQDIWNLFDGICLNNLGQVYFLQMKTNGWGSPARFRGFIYNTLETHILVFNVTNKRKECNGKYRVFVREY